ncbi:GFA family protein [Chelativorans sp. AA-79]|uniref:GFA family protein n=1 Tax=Chelativorans sp. AA-79 TaxID=3028735 RepID=UPI0023F8F945|nr:GFA family protein [Chelativorans sp. AA-79]WEX10073.1 GFA family protein [Chelativorans sp. AA-79]
MQYQGSCHCGEIRFNVDVDLSNPITCNCSYCTQRGSILAFTPAEKFELQQGEQKLTEYRFHTKKIQHLFCSVCGMESFARAALPNGTEMTAINVRCLEGVDLDSLEPTQVDGRSR